MLEVIRRFRDDESGPTAVEYGLLVALIALLAAAGAQILSQNISTIFSKTAGYLAVVPIPTAP